MFIKNFGLFWHRDEVEWHPGTGNTFRLLGRKGAYRGNLRVADFRYQHGIYILYGNYGPYYVGQTKDGLGERIRDHLSNNHQWEWNRFSWFGFRSVLTGTDENGFCRLKEMGEHGAGSRECVITDVEALLIRAMGVSNINQMNFTDAEEWYQIELHEIETYLSRL